MYNLSARLVLMSSNVKHFTAFFIAQAVTDRPLWDSLVIGWTADQIAEIALRAANAVDAGYLLPNDGDGTLYRFTTKGRVWFDGLRTERDERAHRRARAARGLNPHWAEND